MENGDAHFLPAMQDMRIVSSDDKGVQAQEVVEHNEENQRILTMLHAKGFDVEEY